MVRQARRSQARYEVWIRLLNTYQDFSNYARQLMDFADGPKDLRMISLAGAHKCVNDSLALDTENPERWRELRRLVEILQEKPKMTQKARRGIESSVMRSFAVFEQRPRSIDAMPGRCD